MEPFGNVTSSGILSTRVTVQFRTIVDFWHEDAFFCLLRCASKQNCKTTTTIVKIPRKITKAISRLLTPSERSGGRELDNMNASFLEVDPGSIIIKGYSSSRLVITRCKFDTQIKRCNKQSKLSSVKSLKMTAEMSQTPLRSQAFFPGYPGLVFSSKDGCAKEVYRQGLVEKRYSPYGCA